jgi:hypothetical protein
LFAIILFAWVVGHAFDTRDDQTESRNSAAQGRAEHTDWVYTSQESVRMR